MAVAVNVTSLLAVFTLSLQAEVQPFNRRQSLWCWIMEITEFVFVQILLCVCCWVLMIYSAKTLASATVYKYIKLHVLLDSNNRWR